MARLPQAAIGGADWQPALQVSACRRDLLRAIHDAVAGGSGVIALRNDDLGCDLVTCSTEKRKHSADWGKHNQSDYGPAKIRPQGQPEHLGVVSRR